MPTKLLESLESGFSRKKMQHGSKKRTYLAIVWSNLEACKWRESDKTITSKLKITNL